MTSFGKFRGYFRIVSSRAFKRRIVRLSAAIRSRVMTWGRLTPLPSKSRVAKYPSKCRVKRADTALYNLSWETIEGVSGAIIKSAPAVLGPDFGKVKLVILAVSVSVSRLSDVLARAPVSGVKVS